MERVLSNTSNAIFAYVAEDAVRTARPPAFPPELVPYVPTGLSLEISFTYLDRRGNVEYPLTELRVWDPARVRDRWLNAELRFAAVGTFINQVRALPTLASSRP